MKISSLFIFILSLFYVCNLTAANISMYTKESPTSNTLINFEGTVSTNESLYLGTTSTIQNVTFETNGFLFIQDNGQGNARLAFQQATETDYLNANLPENIRNVSFYFTSGEPVKVTIYSGGTSQEFDIGISNFPRV